MTEINHVIGQIATLGLLILGSALLVTYAAGVICWLLEYFFPPKERN